MKFYNFTIYNQIIVNLLTEDQMLWKTKKNFLKLLKK